jgi:hypothetical protein
LLDLESIVRVYSFLLRLPEGTPSDDPTCWPAHCVSAYHSFCARVLTIPLLLSRLGIAGSVQMVKNVPFSSLVASLRTWLQSCAAEQPSFLATPTSTAFPGGMASSARQYPAPELPVAAEEYALIMANLVSIASPLLDKLDVVSPLCLKDYFSCLASLFERIPTVAYEQENLSAMQANDEGEFPVLFRFFQQHQNLPFGPKVEWQCLIVSRRCRGSIAIIGTVAFPARLLFPAQV